MKILNQKINVWLSRIASILLILLFASLLINTLTSYKIFYLLSRVKYTCADFIGNPADAQIEYTRGARYLDRGGVKGRACDGLYKTAK